MKIRWLFLLPLIIFISIVLFLRLGLDKDPNFLPSMLVNHLVPEFQAPSLKDNKTISHHDLQGKVTLINVWASWCGACKLEHPLLMDIKRKTNAQIYGLNYKDNKEAALSYLEKRQDPYSQIIYDNLGKYAMQLGVYGTPETFLIDKKGIIRYRYVGPITLHILENDLLPKIFQLQQEK